MKVLALSSSPRKDGNSRYLAQAVLDGAATRGHDVEIVDLVDAVTSPLRDCRVCRRENGACAIDDDHEQIFLRNVLPADGLVLATPLYWYGVSGQLKVFIDRIFCYIAAGYPQSEAVERQLMGKRMVVAISSEESYPGAVAGITAQMQEMARYLHWDFVGVLRGIGNKRGEIALDPAKPLSQANAFGARLFDERVTDYRIDTPRSGIVWVS